MGYTLYTMKKYTTKKAIALFVFVIAVIFYGVYEKKETKDRGGLPMVATATSTTGGGKIITPEMKNIFTSFVYANYKEWTITGMQYDALCGGGDAYDILLQNKNGEKQSIILDGKGNFIQSEVNMPVATAPYDVVQKVKAQYQGYTYGSEYEKLTMANKDMRYLFDVSKDGGKTSGEVILSNNGEVLCQSGI